MWDPTGDAPRPVLVLGRGRGAVVGVGVLPALGLLAAAHSNGRVDLQVGGWGAFGGVGVLLEDLGVGG